MGMVVSGHSLASLAGIRTLQRGGNLADALVAASAALTVVLGHATSIGGDFFLLYHDAAESRTYGLNSSGVAPSAAVPARFPDGMKETGPLAPVVPGIVRGWEELHRRFGALPWQSLFEDAIQLADAGHPVSKVLVERIPEHRRDLAADPGCAALYLPNGKGLTYGETLRQPALASTLRRVAESGADGFYSGETAARIAAHFAAHSGLVREEDLARYRPFWAEPATTDYRGHRVLVMPPNSYGLLLLMQLNGLSALDSAVLANEPDRRLGYQMSAMKAAFSSGLPLIADPDFVPDAVDRLLGPAATAAMTAAVLGKAFATAVPNRGGTSCLLLADAQGNAICMVQSIFAVFGSAFLDPSTGILFNNRMSGFTHHPDRANSVAPGKRPAHTLCPVLVQRDDRVRFALASPGGISQTLTNVQVITQLLDAGLDIATAVEAPRWCTTRGGEYLVEYGIPENVVTTLAAMGHKVRKADDPYFYGSAKVIERLRSGNLSGAADHRREAFALGC
jgi:gamma-glutamyltranspeptidase/glutathione hydrolase